jgi:hypothetical protein
MALVMMEDVYVIEKRQMSAIYIQAVGNICDFTTSPVRRLVKFPQLGGDSTYSNVLAILLLPGPELFSLCSADATLLHGDIHE